MSWMDQLGGMLQQYAGGGAHQNAPEQVQDHFGQVAQNAPPSAIADGLAAAFRSEQTPPFNQMLGQLFGQSNGQQRAGILNTLIATLGPTIVSQVLARQTEVPPEAAAQVPPQAVAELAAQAEQKDPSIVDTVSNFYAEHPTLVQGLGAAALAIAMSRLASGQNR